MKKNQSLYILGSALIFAAVIAVIWMLSTPAQAQMGNQSIPVRCVPDQPDELMPLGGQSEFRCIVANGMPFGPNNTVPTSYYLLVTDVVVTPERFAPIAFSNWIKLTDVSDSGSVVAQIQFETTSSNTISTHFTTPFLILNSGHRLEGEHLSGDSKSAFVYVSGLLVTNVTNLPFILTN